MHFLHYITYKVDHSEYQLVIFFPLLFPNPYFYCHQLIIWGNYIKETDIPQPFLFFSLGKVIMFKLHNISVLDLELMQKISNENSGFDK